MKLCGGAIIFPKLQELTVDILILSGTTSTTLWRLRKSADLLQTISSTCSAQVWTCCWRPPLWLTQPVTPSSHRKTTELAAHRKTSSPSLSTWQVQREKQNCSRMDRKCGRNQELIYSSSLDTHTHYNTPTHPEQRTFHPELLSVIRKAQWRINVKLKEEISKSSSLILLW